MVEVSVGSGVVSGEIVGRLSMRTAIDTLAQTSATILSTLRSPACGRSQRMNPGFVRVRASINVRLFVAEVSLSRSGPRQPVFQILLRYSPYRQLLASQHTVSPPAFVFWSISKNV
jgi:hypothetical protein